MPPAGLDRLSRVMSDATTPGTSAGDDCRYGILRIVLGGLVIVAVLVLAACQEASAPAKPTIVGEWEVTEYMDSARGDIDLVDEHDITLIFTDDTWVMTFDPPLPGVSEHGAAAIISGSYELLSDSRMLLVYERPVEGQGVVEYSVTATTLTFGREGHPPIKARRM